MIVIISTASLCMCDRLTAATSPWMDAAKIFDLVLAKIFGRKENEMQIFSSKCRGLCGRSRSFGPAKKSKKKMLVFLRNCSFLFGRTERHAAHRMNPFCFRVGLFGNFAVLPEWSKGQSVGPGSNKGPMDWSLGRSIEAAKRSNGHTIGTAGGAQSPSSKEKEKTSFSSTDYSTIICR